MFWFNFDVANYIQESKNLVFSVWYVIYRIDSRYKRGTDIGKVNRVERIGLLSKAGRALVFIRSLLTHPIERKSSWNIIKRLMQKVVIIFGRKTSIFCQSTYSSQTCVRRPPLEPPLLTDGRCSEVPLFYKSLIWDLKLWPL